MTRRRGGASGHGTGPPAATTIGPTSAARSRRIERAAVLGLGKAGGSLVASLEAAGVEVVARARRVGGLARQRRLAEAEVLFIAVPDGVLDATARMLAQRWRTAAHPPLVAHLAGSRGLDALAPLDGCARAASFHPLASLDGRAPIPPGTLLAWDAQRMADGRRLAALARRCGLVAARVPSAQRGRYHAGAVIAGNLPVALLQLGVCLLVEAGVPGPVARISLARLMRSQADNATASTLAAALTGPVARGDSATLERHLAVLASDAGAAATTYRLLSRVLVDDVTTHPEPVKRRLRRALAAGRERHARRE